MAIVLVVVLIFSVCAIFLVWGMKKSGSMGADFYVLGIPCLLGLVFFLQPILLEDNLAYVSYVRSMVMDKDLNIWNEYFLHNSYNIFTHDPREPLGPTG